MELTHDCLRMLLALRQACTPHQAHKLVASIHGPRDVVALFGDLEQRGLASDIHQQIDRQLRVIGLLDLWTVPIWDMPTRWRALSPCPLMLFGRGNARLLRQPAVALVGSRSATGARCDWAYNTAAAAAKWGWRVVSGGALGIDTAAHEGALDHGGETLAYIGVAADEVYPRSNLRLYERILRRGGAVVSEYPPGATTYKSGHVLRNRFIAAHAAMVIVAEAAIGSGSLTTAQFAERLGKPVYVAPSSISGHCAGTDDLLAKGKAQLFPGFVERLQSPWY